MTSVANGDPLLLFADACLVWSATNYLVRLDPLNDKMPVHPPRWLDSIMVRSVAAAAIIGTVAGWRSGWSLAAAMLLGCMILPIGRRHIPLVYTAEYELALGMAAVGGLGMLIASHNLHAHWAPYIPPLKPARRAAVYLLSAIIIAVVRGGTYIVRGILAKAGTLPPLPAVASADPGIAGMEAQTRPVPSVDLIEVNRGRLIGNIERILLVMLVAAGSYEALGFLVAAKGLIRAHELENREWAEYFLIGSLASILVALGAGILLRHVLAALW